MSRPPGRAIGEDRDILGEACTFAETAIALLAASAAARHPDARRRPAVPQVLDAYDRMGATIADGPAWTPVAPAPAGHGPRHPDR